MILQIDFVTPGCLGMTWTYPMSFAVLVRSRWGRKWECGTRSGRKWECGTGAYPMSFAVFVRPGRTQGTRHSAWQGSYSMHVCTATLGCTRCHATLGCRQCHATLGCTRCHATLGCTRCHALCIGLCTAHIAGWAVPEPIECLHTQRVSHAARCMRSAVVH